MYRLGVGAARGRKRIFLLWATVAALSLVLLPGLAGSIGMPNVGMKDSEATHAADLIAAQLQLREDLSNCAWNGYLWET